MTNKPASDLPALPEPASTAYVEGPAMQGGEYRTLSTNYEPDCAMYSPNQVREIQEAAFNAGRAEAGKDAERLDWLEKQTESHGFCHTMYGEYRYYAHQKQGYASVREVLDAASSQEPK